jgi:NDP-sugar pyrophosphorylase family protein
MGANYMKTPKEERVGYIVKSTEIGEYTFIGSGSYIMPGVKIGKGCVIGTNSVVTKDIPDYSIAVGSPAKVIKSTLDVDREYFENPKVRECYFDSSVILLCLIKKSKGGKLDYLVFFLLFFRIAGIMYVLKYFYWRTSPWKQERRSCC